MEPVSIVTIKEILPLYKGKEKANNVELIHLEEAGFDIVSQKGLYKVGDKAIYILPDYCVSDIDLFQEFIAPKGDESKSYLGKIDGKPRRIRAKKFSLHKGDRLPVYSNGILLSFYEVCEYLQDDDLQNLNLTKELSITKYEIPEEILIQHVNSITPEWFKTLSAFSYFNNFLNDYINSYSTNTEWLDSKQCYETYRYLEQNGYNDLFEKLEGTLVNHIQIKLDTLNTQYSKITNIREYEYLKDDVNQLFKYSESLEKKYFKNIITQLVANSSNSDVKLKAYMDLYIDNLAFDEIIDIFKNRKNYEEFPKALIKLLLTISPQQQIELIFKIYFHT